MAFGVILMINLIDGRIPCIIRWLKCSSDFFFVEQVQLIYIRTIELCHPDEAFLI